MLFSHSSVNKGSVVGYSIDGLCSSQTQKFTDSESMNSDQSVSLKDMILEVEDDVYI